MADLWSIGRGDLILGIVTRGTGNREIRFAYNGPKMFRLGRMPIKNATTAQNHIGNLLAGHGSGQAIPPATVDWLANLPDELRKRLANTGLVEQREQSDRPTVAAFIDGYIGERLDMKASSRTVLTQARVWLVRYLGDGRRIDAVTVSDADGYRAHMIASGLAKATIAKRCKGARQFFDVAKRRGLIENNPFGHIATGSTGNAARRVFDDAEDGAVYVVNRYRSAGVNLRTQLQRYIEQAGVKPWAKLWQNLRASRATELADSFPSHVCAAWLGHTEAVADGFYRTVTDSHFARATEQAHQQAHQNAHQQPPAMPRDAAQQQGAMAVSGSLRDIAPDCVGECGPGRIRTSDLTLIRGAL